MLWSGVVLQTLEEAAEPNLTRHSWQIVAMRRHKEVFAADFLQSVISDPHGLQALEHVVVDPENNVATHPVGGHNSANVSAL